MTEDLCGPQHWAVLGIEPTGSAEQVRAAYRSRLRDTNPESDPDGFQTLRQAHDLALQACARPASTSAGRAGVDTDALVHQLVLRRAAGDEAGAMALVDDACADLAPGSAEGEAIEDAILDEVALQRSLSPALFGHLATRFDWRDIRGHAARRDPEHHAVILDRLAAEDLLAAIRSAAEGPDGRVERLLLADHGSALRGLGSQGLDAGERSLVRELFDRLLEHGRFLIGRFDGGTLALLREAVEGPPSLGSPAPSDMAAHTATSATGGVEDMLTPKTRRGIRIGVFTLVGAVLVGKMVMKSDTPYVGKDTALPAQTALPLLKDPAVPWVDMIQEPDGVRVDWAPVMKMRHAITDLRVGYNGDKPTTVFPLPEWDAPIGFLAPAEITSIAMRVRSIDGQWSAVRVYSVPHGGQ